VRIAHQKISGRVRIAHQKISGRVRIAHQKISGRVRIAHQKISGKVRIAHPTNFAAGGFSLKRLFSELEDAPTRATNHPI